MPSYAISKSDNRVKLNNKITLEGGYSFRGKTHITMYEKELTKFILVKKINSALKNIMYSLINFDEDDDDGTKASELEIRIETLRVLLLEKYFPFIGKTRANAYLSRLAEIEERLPRKEKRSSKTR